jgi:hypothetical protein
MAHFTYAFMPDPNPRIREAGIESAVLPRTPVAGNVRQGPAQPQVERQVGKKNKPQGSD